MRVVKLSVVLNVITLLTKSAAYAYTFAGVALVEALHSLGDLLNSLLLYVGVRLSKRGSSIKYPFGYGRSIYVFSFLSASMVLGFLVAVGFMEGVMKLMNPEEIMNPYIGLYLLLMSLVLDLIVLIDSYLSERRVKRQGVIEGHPALKGLIVENLIDVLSSGTGMVAFTLSINNPVIDGYGSIVLSVILLIGAYHLAHENFEFLIGRSAPKEVVGKAIKIVLGNPAVVDVNDVKSLVIEPGKYLLIMQVEVLPTLTFDDVAQVKNELIKDLRELIPSIKYVLLDMVKPEEPPKTYRKILSELIRLT